MNEIERRLRELADRLTALWNSGSRDARGRRAARRDGLRQSASARAQQAASAAREFRDSERGQRAASKLNDLRAGETAKKAEAAWGDLRASETGKKAESALNDLRQRDSVKKAEESARKAVHDLFSGSTGSGPSSAS